MKVIWEPCCASLFSQNDNDDDIIYVCVCADGAFFSCSPSEDIKFALVLFCVVLILTTTLLALWASDLFFVMTYVAYCES